mmetsp:Transcript_15369/g.37758  ORF Transcript_15369/g.37758 Transcript_15369/m.37758 type:complete len:87 (-) Transcript_15369:848-1108(-)
MHNTSHPYREHFFVTHNVRFLLREEVRSCCLFGIPANSAYAFTMRCNTNLDEMRAKLDSLQSDPEIFYQIVRIFESYAHTTEPGWD